MCFCVTGRTGSRFLRSVTINICVWILLIFFSFFKYFGADDAIVTEVYKIISFRDNDYLDSPKLASYFSYVALVFVV